MAIKISGTDVIDNNRRGIFKKLNPGVYTTAQRDALSAIEGDVIYNSDDEVLQVYNGTEWGAADGSGRSGPFSATGGDEINTYTVNGIQYKSHTFTQPGDFVVTGDGVPLDLLIVGGGGAGGPWLGAGQPGGGGAGEVIYRENYSDLVGKKFDNWIYRIVVGSGGTSSIGWTGESSIAFNFVADGGGGGNGSYSVSGTPVAGRGMRGGSSGGSGTGQGGNTSIPQSGLSGHPGAIDSQSLATQGWGNKGSTTPGSGVGSGGGGAFSDGLAAPSGRGGDGAQYTIKDGTAIYYGGGGAGLRSDGAVSAGGKGGGGPAQPGPSTKGTDGLGGGGGAGAGGGSGTVIIRYRIS